MVRNWGPRHTILAVQRYRNRAQPPISRFENALKTPLLQEYIRRCAAKSDERDWAFRAGEYLRPHPRFQVGRSGSTNEAGRTHGTPHCRPPAPTHCGSRRIDPSSGAQRFKLPQPDCIASSVDVAITTCAQLDRNVHRCIRIATTRPSHLKRYGS